jgi:hypothetical protein
MMKPAQEEQMAEEIDEEEAMREAEAAQAIGEKIEDICEGHTRLAVMGALTVLLGRLAYDAENEGLPAGYFIARFVGALRSNIAARRELEKNGPLQ